MYESRAIFECLNLDAAFAELIAVAVLVVVVVVVVVVVAVLLLLLLLLLLCCTDSVAVAFAGIVPILAYVAVVFAKSNLLMQFL